MGMQLHRVDSREELRRRARPACKIFAFGIAVLTISGCHGPALSGEVVPALSPRPHSASCLAGVELPGDPEVALELPQALSATGCFADLVTQTPAPDLIPYWLNSPLWTDGVIKQRYMVLPPGATIGFAETGPWQFPDGTVLVKMFLLETETGNRQSRRAIETRLMVRAAGAWEFFSYEWNRDGSDALLSNEAHTAAFEVQTADGQATIWYDFPDHLACVTCHAQGTGQVLGPIAAQLNRDIHYDSGWQNQLWAMQAIGLFGDRLPGDPSGLSRMADPADTGAPLAARARSYLAANCAHCHLPGGYNSIEVDIDLRYQVPLGATRTCAEPIKHPIYHSDGELIIDPGKPENSNLYGRMIRDRKAPSKMPPIGRSITDPLGSELVRQWIASLAECSAE